MALNHPTHPVLHPVRIEKLRPTQMTVGYREVARKRHDWRERLDRDGPDFLGRHMIPVVTGPGGTMWLIDNHHLARALHDEGVKEVLVSIVASLDHLGKRRFMTFMENRNWLHPYDAEGKRVAYKEVPRSVAKLVDDPYRSLAGEMRRAGGFAKVETPYAEFLWADFLRPRVPARLLERDFDKAVMKALHAAHGEEAVYLPGYCGTY
ncbi:MAG: ParB-like protein [Sphingomonas sp.]|jgi:hypothetical protein|uniref:ParB-like protein n=1 Tax=Sphingomonas sp. TaxID=28214 RepID=UPI0035617618